MDIRITFDGTENEFNRHAILDAYRQILANLLRNHEVSGLVREANLLGSGWEMIQTYQKGYGFEKVMNPKPVESVTDTPDDSAE